MSQSTNDTVKAVIQALTIFSGQPDKSSLDRANTWLQDFQKTPDAWVVCNVLLLSPDTPDSARTFAAQTFRAKVVTFDLHQLDSAARAGLRNTLLTALQRYAAGPRVVLIQLCLALAGLALQMPDWDGVVPGLIQSLGQNPATVPALLEFLTVLPEEVTNGRIPISNEDYRIREADLVTANADDVLKLLSMYIQATGVTSAVQNQVFQCLRRWIEEGQIPIPALAETPLFAYAFEALAYDELFDTAVSVICDIVHETQEIADNMAVIELIVPRLLALKPMIHTAGDDSDKMRGYSRIFTEAGETYRVLILEHPETFFPIVEAIAECTTYSDLDVVPITFAFWYRLAQSIGKKPSVSQPFFDIFKALVGIIIRHLHFPADLGSMTGQEKDDFRSFRHVMGDTLKDCCYVLGSRSCLLTAYDMITSVLSRATSPSAEPVTWQEIEAPLFSMRSMGAEIDPTDDEVIPKIMDLIPSLPTHPRVRYAATLVIARYTEWLDRHPDYVQFQLTYVSAGFNDADTEVSAAAGQAIKYMCKDCKQHLVPYLPQLHTFVTTVGPRLAQDDRVQVYEAVAHIISYMPMEDAARAFRQFGLEIVGTIHNIASRATPATKDDLQVVTDSLEQLEIMLRIIQTFGDEPPIACQNTCQEVWPVFDTLLAKYGSVPLIAETCAKVLRLGIEFFGQAGLPVIPGLLERMTISFEANGLPSYLWIFGKAVGRFGNEEDVGVRTAFKTTYERCSAKLFTMLKNQPPSDIPDVLEDYIHLLLQMVDFTPDLMFLSPAFPHAFGAVLSSLTLLSSHITFAALDFVRIVVNHDCMIAAVQIRGSAPTTPQPPVPPKFPLYAAAIRQVIDDQGFQLVGLLLTGLVSTLPEDSTSIVVSIFRILAPIWSNEMLAWLPPVMDQIPAATLPVQAKQQFITDFNNAIAAGELDKVKQAVVNLHRASRKARDRSRFSSTLDR